MSIGARNAQYQWQATALYDDVPFATELAPVGDADTIPINLVALLMLCEQCQMRLIPETLELLNT
ncbi:hypothetical protein ACEU07_15055 [Chromobacterium violaceum]|uniref:hypothetical protein n=1 Tax=Chromobacterium violaceum TaxID=536 RepID=UPI0035A6ED20